MSLMASQITSLTIVYSNSYSDVDQRKHQSSASLAFVWEFTGDRWIFPFDDVIMCWVLSTIDSSPFLNWRVILGTFNLSWNILMQDDGLMIRNNGRDTSSFILLMRFIEGPSWSLLNLDRKSFIIQETFSGVVSTNENELVIIRVLNSCVGVCRICSRKYITMT